MPRAGQSLAERLPYQEAVDAFGEAAVRALGRVDNLKKRGITWHAVAELLRSAQRVQISGDTITLEGAGLSTISAKDRGFLLDALRDLLAILRSRPDEFRQLCQLIRSMARR